MLRKLLLALLLCLVAAPSWAAVTFDAKGTTDCTATGTSPRTVTCTTLTIGSITNGVLAVPFAYTAGSSATVTGTWNTSQTLTLVNSQYSGAASIGTGFLCLAAPTSGNHTLSVTFTASGTIEAHIIGASFAGADQTTPCKNYNSVSSPATTATASIPVTSTTGDMAVAAFSQDQQFHNSTNGTTIIIDDSGPSIGWASNYIAGSSSTTAPCVIAGSCLTATAAGTVSDWQISGIDIAAASGGGSAKAAMIIDEDGVFAP